MIRPTVARVDLDAIRSNFRAISGFLSGRARVIAVVKANAYGHGSVEVGRTLESAGAAMLACADIEEAIALREGGVRAPILVFGALSVSDLEGVVTHDLTPTISTPGAARALHAIAARHGVVLHCHLKIDTGMNRLGFRHDNLRRTLPDAASRHLAIDAVYTNFRDMHGLDAECREARRDGFVGKMAIHPAQVPIINAAFAPTPEEIARARAVVAAFADNPGAGVVGVDGEMLDRPHLLRAERLLARAGEGN